MISLESTTPAVTIPPMTPPSMRCNDAVEIFRQLTVDDPIGYASLLSRICAE
jgi:hypothetical protein